MAKRKTPELHIRISGPQGTGKTTLAHALAGVVGATVDGDKVSRQPGSLIRLADVARRMSARVVITTTNEGAK